MAAKVEEAHAPEEPAAPEPAAPEPEGEELLDALPKKANWDLHRDVAKKLEKLEKRTQARSPSLVAPSPKLTPSRAQRAIVELARQEEVARLALEQS